MDYKKLICSNIKKLRICINLTQFQFAETIGISIEALRNIEQCKSTPTAKTIDRICLAYKVTPFDLLIPEVGKDEEALIASINKKLKLCTKNQLSFIDSVIESMRREHL